MPGQLKEIKSKIKENPAARNTYIALGALISILLVVVLVLVLSPSREEAVKVAKIRITDQGFVPEQVVVEPGTKVIWTNTDNKLHSVASNPYPKNNDLPGLKSEILNNNQSYEYIANQTGTFGYHDDINPTINGVIEVQ